MSRRRPRIPPTARQIAAELSAALDPTQAHSKVRRLMQMTLEERAELERLYTRK